MVLGGVGAGLAQPAISLAMDRNPQEAARHLIHNWTFLDPWDNFKLKWHAPTGLVGLGVGALGSMIASKLGLNRYISELPFKF
jgi:hypothetical protein